MIQPAPTPPVNGTPAKRGADVVRTHAPGLALCAVAAVIAMVVHAVVPSISPLVVAIVAGIAVANLVRLPESTSPGVAVASKKLLRLGIVFLGLQLVIGDIIALGLPTLAVIVGVVAIGIVGTILMGRALRMPAGQTLLIACGFSICGAAAVAAVEGVTDSDEEDIVTAIALVVIFGTLMIPVIPLAGGALGMEPELIGMWAGGSIHEIAQVVAAGTVVGGGALAAAVLVKLARVLMLAPVIAVLSLHRRRLSSASSDAGSPGAARPAIVPLFMVGFLAMIALRSTLTLPELVLDLGQFAQLALLSAAMFALGCGVRVRALMHVGSRPFLLATASTVLVTAVALAGIVLVHPTS